MTLARRRLLNPECQDNMIWSKKLSGASGAKALESITHSIVNDSDSFEMNVKSAQIGFYEVRSITTTPINYIDTPVADHEPNIRFVFVVSGSIAIRQGTTLHRVFSGEMIILFEREMYSTLILEPTHMVMVSFPEIAASQRGVVSGGHLRHVAAASVLSLAARAFFLGLLRPSAFPLPPVEQLRATRAIDSVLLGLLATAENPSASKNDRNAEERAVITSFIASNFSSPALSTASVASQYGMSTRSIQRLFAECGQSVSESIQQRRLEHAVAILLDERFDELSVEDVAKRSGFTGADHLRRVMHHEMGCAPSQARANR